MNSPSLRTPPLVCRWMRFRSALAATRPVGVDRHCATCANCRQYFTSEEQLDVQLRSQAGGVRAVAPATLDARVLTAIRRTEASSHRNVRPYSWGIAALAGAALVTLLLTRQPIPPANETRTPEAEVQELLVVAKALPAQIAGLQPTVLNLLEQNPLQTEIVSVRTDAKSALDFLALNFLPSDSRARTGASANPET